MINNYRKGLYVLCAAALLLTTTSLRSQTATWVEPAVNGTDDQSINDVAVDGNGSAYAVGFFKGTSISVYNLTTINNTDGTGATYDGFLTKYDRETGDAIWGVNMGGASNDYTTSVTTYPEGTDYVIYICGHFNGTMTFNSTDGTTTKSLTSAGLQDAYVAKYSSSGIVQWAYRIGSTANDGAYHIVATTTTNGMLYTPGAAIYVCGVYGANVTFKGTTTDLTKNLMANGNDAYVVRYIDAINASDVYAEWARGLGTSAGADSYYGVGADPNGNVVTTGVMYNGTATYDVSSSATSTFAANGTTEAVGLCYNPSGTLIWADHYGGTAGDVGLTATMDLNGNSYLGGEYTGTGTFGGNNFTNLGAGYDAYAISVSPTGTVQWVSTGGTRNTDDGITSLAIDNCGKHLYATGTYRGTCSFAGFSFSPYSTGSADIDTYLITMDASTGNGITGDGISMGGSGGTENRTAVAVNGMEDVYVSGTFASLDWNLGSAGVQFSNSNNPANGHTDGSLMRWDNINFPAEVTVTTPDVASHRGVGVYGCSIYAGGQLTGGAGFGSIPLYSDYYTFPSMTYTQDVYLSQCDKYGNYTSAVKVVKGKSDAYLYDQAVDASGNNFLCGAAGINFASSDVTFNDAGSTTFNITNGGAGWLCKTNSSGTTQWAAWINGTGSSNYAQIYGITYDASGDVYTCGTFTGTQTFSDPACSTPITKTCIGNQDMFVAKYSGSNGCLQWVKQFSASTATIPAINAQNISVVGSDYYVTGAFRGNTTIGSNTLVSTTNNIDMFLMRGSCSTGNGTYALKYGTASNDWGMDVVATATNAVYVAGFTGTTAFIGKASLSSASPSWTWSHTNSAGTATGDRILYSGGSVYMGGDYTAGATLTFGSLSTSTLGAFVVRYASGGGYEQCLNAYPSKDLYGIAAETAGSLNNDGGDNILIAGGAKAYIHTLGMNSCLFTERHGITQGASASESAVSSSDNSLFSSTIYPNPADGSVTLQLNGVYDLSMNSCTLLVYDMSGRVVKQLNGIVNPVTTFETADLADGFYQYELVSSDNQVISLGKMVVRH
jgi:hypothetical protein